MNHLEEENIFLMAGVLNSPTEFHGGIGVYDYFWALTPDLQQKLLESWRDCINKMLDDDELLAEMDPCEAEGNMVIMVNADVVEVRKPQDNVVPFKR